MRITLSDLLELLGVAAIGVAVAAWDWRAFLALVGVLLTVAGYLLAADDDQELEL